MTTIVAAFVGNRAESAAVPSSNHELVSPFDLVGLPIATARQLAEADGVRLRVLGVPSDSPIGRVIGEDPNYPSDPTVVISAGPLQDRFKVLAPATVPPAHAECAGGLQLDGDGNVGPLTCHGGVNVAAWQQLARLDIPVMALGRKATKAEVVNAICSPNPTAVLGDSAYQLAEAYNGWQFGEQLYLDYVYGLHGKHCPGSQARAQIRRYGRRRRRFYGTF